MVRPMLARTGVLTALLLLWAGVTLAFAGEPPRSTYSLRDDPILTAIREMGVRGMLGPLLLLVGLVGTGFIEHRLHQALIADGRLRWDFGPKELYGVIAGCPFFGFIMAGAMFLPVFIQIPHYLDYTFFRIIGWTLICGGILNGLLLSLVIVRITRWTCPGNVRYGAAAAVGFNSLAMIGHAYFLCLNPGALHKVTTPGLASAILWAVGLTCILLFLLTWREGAVGMRRVFLDIDWAYVKRRVARFGWAAAALIGLCVNLFILPLWPVRSRLLSMPWKLHYVFDYGTPGLLLFALILWNGGRRTDPDNRLLAVLSSVFLFAAALQLFAFPRLSLGGM